MFPGPNATIIVNEAGEPLGWDYPSDSEFDAGDPGDDNPEMEYATHCPSCGAYFEEGEEGFDSEECFECGEPTMEVNG